MRLGDVDATPFTSRVFVILDIEKSSNIGTGGRVALRSYAAAAHDLLRATPLLDQAPTTRRHSASRNSSLCVVVLRWGRARAHSGLLRQGLWNYLSQDDAGLARMVPPLRIGLPLLVSVHAGPYDHFLGADLLAHACVLPRRFA